MDECWVKTSLNSKNGNIIYDFSVTIFTKIYILGAKRGDFCFHKDGTRGTVDDNYSQVPVNRNCDPRITCGLGVSSLAQCNADAPTMKNIAVRITLLYLMHPFSIPWKHQKIYVFRG